MLEVGKCYIYIADPPLPLIVYITSEDADYYYCNYVTDVVYYHDHIHKGILALLNRSYYQEIAFSTYALAVMKGQYP